MEGCKPSAARPTAGAATPCLFPAPVPTRRPLGACPPSLPQSEQSGSTLSSLISIDTEGPWIAFAGPAEEGCTELTELCMKIYFHSEKQGEGGAGAQGAGLRMPAAGHTEPLQVLRPATATARCLRRAPLDSLPRAALSRAVCRPAR